MNVAHKIEYKIRDLPTRAVTLFPDQALVQREIKDISLKPGVNEITIVGLSPTTNKDSVKIEGSGSATIIGVTAEGFPNTESFDDVYSQSESEEPDSEDDLDDDSDEEPAELIEIKARLLELQDDLARADEAISNAQERANILNSYCNTLESRDERIDVQKLLIAYKQEREKSHADRMAGWIEKRRLQEAIGKTTKEHARLLKAVKKKNAKWFKERCRIVKAKEKKRAQRLRKHQETQKTRERLRDERKRLWPRWVYTVTIQLEANAAFTPGSSRRGSVSSDNDVVMRSSTKTADAEDPVACDLVLSYITYSASWTPSYDLQLSTPNSTATLCFDACLNNTTSETWENCKLTLSTSQAAFAGASESVPALQPWRIRLAPESTASPSAGITNSAQELQERIANRTNAPIDSIRPRWNMFEVPEAPASGFFGGGPPPGIMNAIGRGMPGTQQLSDYQMQLMLLEQQNKKRTMMARQERDGQQPQGPQQMTQQRQQQAQQQHAQQQAMQQQQQAQQQAMQQQQQGPMFGSNVPQQPTFPPQMLQQMGTGAEDDDLSWTPPNAQPALEFQESLVDETGFTTTYDLPGLKTLAPKESTTKQRVARISFASVYFGHTVVAKYHAAAYLKTRVRNTSKWTLLRGPATLSLDGSFMGKSTIPRCSPGDTFGLSLGVDPTIKVAYPRAEVKRSTGGHGGMFKLGGGGSDTSVGYARAVVVHHTRASAAKPAKVIVFDQVPVSEDERLRTGLAVPGHGCREGLGVGGGWAEGGWNGLLGAYAQSG